VITVETQARRDVELLHSQRSSSTRSKHQLCVAIGLLFGERTINARSHFAKHGGLNNATSSFNLLFLFYATDA